MPQIKKKETSVQFFNCLYVIYYILVIIILGQKMYTERLLCD